MPEKKKLIDEDIKIIPLRRNYLSISSYGYYNDNSNKKITNLFDTNQTPPAGIPGKNPSIIISRSDTRTTDKKSFVGETHNNLIYEELSEPPHESQFPSMVRFYSLLPEGEDLNIILRGRTVLPNVSSDLPTQYIQLDPGSYEMCFYGVTSTDSLQEYKFDAISGAVKTLVIVNSDDGYRIIELNETANDCYENAAYVRFIQSSLSAPSMDIYIDNIPVILGILPGEISEFIGLTAGTHTIRVAAAATSIIYIQQSFNFSARSANNLFIVANPDESYSFFVLTNEDACI